MLAGSRFEASQLWVVLWLALHNEDVKDVMNYSKDSSTLFQMGFFVLSEKFRLLDLAENNNIDQDEAISFLPDVAATMDAQAQNMQPP